MRAHDTAVWGISRACDRCTERTSGGRVRRRAKACRGPHGIIFFFVLYANSPPWLSIARKIAGLMGRAARVPGLNFAKAQIPWIAILTNWHPKNKQHAFRKCTRVSDIINDIHTSMSLHWCDIIKWLCIIATPSSDLLFAVPPNRGSCSGSLQPADVISLMQQQVWRSDSQIIKNTLQPLPLTSLSPHSRS